jgi:hypothetical protein
MTMVLALPFLLAAAPVQSKPDFTLQAFPGQRRMLFDWSKRHCPAAMMIPDAPVRAFRDARGSLTVIAAHYQNWTMRGRSFTALKPDCKTVFGPADTGSDQHAWIEATYTLDGRTVTGLLSRELSTDERPIGCSPAKGTSCWLSDIVAVQSDDMGRRYRMGKVVASLGTQMPQNSPSRFGAFTTSNIARGQNGYYMVIYLQGDGVIRGNCLLRSDDPMNSALWRAWDGNQFTIDMSRRESARACKILSGLDQPVRSISWVPRKQLWLAMLATQRIMKGRLVQGFFYAVSPDLRHWQPPRLTVEAALSGRQMGWDSFWNYPVLIDPMSRSRNFETLDHDEAFLIFTEQHLERRTANGTMDRDLVAIPVKITGH